MEQTKKRIEAIIYITLAFVPLIYVPIGEFNDFFYAPKVLALTGLMAVFMWLIFVERRNIGNLLERDIINGTLLIYFALLAVSLFFASDIRLAIQGNLYRQEGFSTLILYALLFLAARNCQSFNENNFGKILYSASLIAVYGIFQYYNIDPFPSDFIRKGWVAPYSTIGNPNFLGSYLVLMLPFAGYFFICKGKKSALGHFSILFWCLLATNTRSAWIGTIFAAITFIYILPLKTRKLTVYY